MPNTVDAVVTDLDGTMWATDLSVHAETAALIDRLDAADIPLLIATGRRAHSALVGLRSCGLADRPGVLMNGALARDRLEGPSFLTEAIALEDAQRTIDTFREGGLEPLVYVDDPEADMVVGPEPAAGRRYIDSAPGVQHVHDLEEALAVSTVIGFGAFGFPRSVLDPIADAINGNGWATAIVGPSMFEGDHGMMIQGAGIDKITAIRAWCDRHDLDATNLAVLGDGANDIGMLQAAHVAIVPTNATLDVQAYATDLIDPPDDGGWRAVAGILGLS